MRLAALALLAALAAAGAQPFYDRSHFSQVFHEERRYRILLPPGYETSGKAYPVIYYFHGHSDRYTVEHYDEGTETHSQDGGFRGPPRRDRGLRGRLRGRATTRASTAARPGT